MSPLGPLLLLALCASPKAQNLDEIMANILTNTKDLVSKTSGFQTTIETIANRVEGIERKVSETASNNSLTQLQKEVAAVAGRVNSIDSQLQSAANTWNSTQLTRIENSVINLSNQVNAVDSAQQKTSQEVSQVLNQMKSLEDIMKQMEITYKNQTSVGGDQHQTIKTLVEAIKKLTTQVSSQDQQTRQQLMELQEQVSHTRKNSEKLVANLDSSPGCDTEISASLKQLETSANQSQISSRNAEQCCQSNSNERRLQLNNLLKELSDLKDLQRRALKAGEATRPTVPLATIPPTQTPASRPTAVGTTSLSGLPVDCADAFARGLTAPGSYTLQPAGSNPMKAACMEGWTTIQRRIAANVDFDRPISEYISGFGLPNLDHWIGLRPLHLMTNKHSCNMKAQFYLDDGGYKHSTHYQKYAQDGDQKEKYLEIAHFVVGDSHVNYELTLSGITTNLQHPDVKKFESYHDNAAFSAKDYGTARGCATSHSAGWWYKTCAVADFNGRYQGFVQSGFLNLSRTNRCSKNNKICALINPYMVKSVEMKIKC